MAAFGAQVVATYPNTDDGGRAILRRLEGWAAGREGVAALEVQRQADAAIERIAGGAPGKQ